MRVGNLQQRLHSEGTIIFTARLGSGWNTVSIPNNFLDQWITIYAFKSAGRWKLRIIDQENNLISNSIEISGDYANIDDNFPTIGARSDLNASWFDGKISYVAILSDSIFLESLS